MSISVNVKLLYRTVEALDVVAKRLQRSREDVIRLAVETYLDDFEDVTVSLDRLQDEADLIHDWDEVKRVLLNFDDEERS